MASTFTHAGYVTDQPDRLGLLPRVGEANLVIQSTLAALHCEQKPMQALCTETSTGLCSHSLCTRPCAAVEHKPRGKVSGNELAERIA